MSREFRFTFEVPTNGILADPDTGYDMIDLDGTLQRVAYHVDLGIWRVLEGDPGHRRLGPSVWRAAGGEWRIGTYEECLGRLDLQATFEFIELPAVPGINEAATPVPRLIHFIWIGENGIPDALARNITVNAQRGTGFRTIVHVHAETATGMARVRAQLTSSGVEVNDLLNEPAYARFMQSPLGPFYTRFLADPTRNYGAASDMLRMHLLYTYGGIYMDCDDTIVNAFPVDAVLLAAPDDLLLNAMISAPSVDFAGYNQSSFACQPANPLLTKILDSMAARLQGAADFMAAPRPWRTASTDSDPSRSTELNAYVARILALTGPSIFSQVLQQARPDYFAIERSLLSAYEKTTYGPGEPRYVADVYMDAMRAAMAYYVPFAHAPFEIVIGNADSWNIRFPASGQGR